MEVIHSSETSVNIRTTWRNIPEDDNIHNYRFENLKSYSNSMLYILHQMLLVSSVQEGSDWWGT
jgi:hypothetical protein